MIARSVDNHQIYTYTWNPQWDDFKYLSLNRKLTEFVNFVVTSQGDFLEKAPHDEKAICLLVAPEMIFTPAEETNRGVYSASEHGLLASTLGNLCNTLDERVLIIAGSIQYLTDKRDQYVNRSYIVSRNVLNYYDKKATTGPITIRDENEKTYSINMQEGTTSGLIVFKNIRIGLEICLDHEESTLLNELKNQLPADIHILICDGQNIRKGNIVTSKIHPGLFIVCELNPEMESRRILIKTHEKTACYSTSMLRVNTSNENIDRYRSSYALVLTDILRNLNEIEGVKLSSSILCSIATLSLQRKHVSNTNINQSNKSANCSSSIKHVNYEIDGQLKKLNLFDVLDVLFKDIVESLANTNIQIPKEMTRIAMLIKIKKGYKIYENNALIKIEKMINIMMHTYKNNVKGNELYLEFCLRMSNTICAYKTCDEMKTTDSIDRYHNQLAYVTSVLNQMHDNILNIKYLMTQTNQNTSLNIKDSDKSLLL